jgi:hypothetical protein
MNIIRKDAEITNTGSDDDFPGTFEVILSTPSLDRDGDELATDDWEQPLPEHITFDVDHGMSVASTVGSGTPSIDDKGHLVVAGTYSSLPRAQDTRTLVREGHIRTTSVAFMNKKVTKGGQSRVVRELLNGAFVAIPSNREALVTASKSLSDDSPAGAAIGVKTIAGSYEQRQQALCDALEGAYPDPPDNGYVWTYPLATFDDSVVYRVSGDTDARGQWQASYTVNDDGTVTLGNDAQRVTMVETVVPVSGTVPKGFRLVAGAQQNIGKAATAADAEQSGTESSAAAESAAATSEPDAAAADAAAEDLAASEVQVRAARIRALAAVASLEGDNQDG